MAKSFLPKKKNPFLPQSVAPTQQAPQQPVKPVQQAQKGRVVDFGTQMAGGSPVKVTIDGKTYNLTNEEYKASLPSGFGRINPEYQAALKAHDENLQMEAAIKGAIRNKQISDAAGSIYNPQKTITPEQEKAVNSVGVLNPEQFNRAYATDASMPMQKGEILSQIGASAITQGTIGAGTGASAGLTAGLLGAVPTAGLSVPAFTALGAAAGGAAGLISGTITGTFAAFKHGKTENVKITDQNVQKAKYNIRQSIILANKGGDSQTNADEFNNAVAELRLAQRQLQEQSKSKYAWATDVRLKQNDLENYLAYTLPTMTEKMQIALLKPDPAYIDNGLDSEGNPV